MTQPPFTGTIVLATHNTGKVRELQAPLTSLGLKVIGLDELTGFSPESLEVEETGATFRENALLKAATIAKLTGFIAIADDSGLIVDALNGAPGIYSARYGQDVAHLEAYKGLGQDERNVQKLLHAMHGVPDARRTARFCSAMAAASPKGFSVVAEGFWEGTVTRSPRGSNGFGYDPVFYCPQSGLTAAEMPAAQKMGISHRAKALQSLVELLPGFMEQIV